MKILHTSDWHLGRHFYNESLIEDQQQAIELILRYLRRHGADVVIIAGDVFDRAVPSVQAVALLDDFINDTVLTLGIPVILTAGNHDGARRLDFGSRVFRENGLYVFASLYGPGESPQPVIIKDRWGDVAFYGIPYFNPADINRLAPDLDITNFDLAWQACLRTLPAATGRRVLIGHAFLSGGESSESERLLTVAGDEAVSWRHFCDYDYVALGHLHKPQWVGKPYIRYSGSLLKYSFSELGHEKSFSVVTLDQNGFQGVEQIPLPPVRDLKEIEGTLDDILQGRALPGDGGSPATDDFIRVRLSDQCLVLDAMNRIRQVYPNVMELVREGLAAVEPESALRVRQEQSPLNLFRYFFQQVCDKSLHPNQEKILLDVVAAALSEDETNPVPEHSP